MGKKSTVIKDLNECIKKHVSERELTERVESVVNREAWAEAALIVDLYCP